MSSWPGRGDGGEGVSAGSAPKILVIGPERSGTTWISQALCAATGAGYVHEPDSPGVNPQARHETTLGRYPVLRQGQEGPELHDYIALWDLAFSGSWPLKPVPGPIVDAFSRLPGPLQAPLTRWARAVLQLGRSAKVEVRGRLARSQAAGVRTPPRGPLRPVLVKTVYAMFALEWLTDRYRPDHVVVVRRDPVAIAASLLSLGTGPDRLAKLRAVYEHPVNRQRFVEALDLPDLPGHLDIPQSCAWWAAFVTTVLATLAAGHPEWLCVDHSELVKDPVASLGELAAQVGGTDRASLERFVSAGNRPGSGFSLKRSSGHSVSEAAQREDQAHLRAVVDLFPGA